MFKFQFVYGDKSYLEFENITKVKYADIIGEEIIVLENEILEHKFPLNADLYLFSKNSNNTASCNNLKTISVIKEE
ncbi:hypothetical protein [Desulfosporosinus sp. SB140]|uniref:hypothetical protein n=1 Tax=Desulfosporosinus paludis TaxID=3115649 RepID=UPI00388E5CDA